MVHLLAVGRPGQQQEIQSPKQVLHPAAFTDTTSQLGQLAQVFQPIPRELSAGKPAQIVSFAAGHQKETLSRCALFGLFLLLLPLLLDSPSGCR